MSTNLYADIEERTNSIYQYIEIDRGIEELTSTYTLTQTRARTHTNIYACLCVYVCVYVPVYHFHFKLMSFFRQSLRYIEFRNIRYI